ncbi:DUF2254 domain-containing protein [Tabrizicola aquatica]|uniref:DUF2254 domain-containing protein n=1 Tax=Tabrizicola aquatica TaxID=909926 RepID=UPI000CD0F4BD|nr:DUF2254 domain-containing protein [Tabrizicola aquatica]
MSRIQWLLSRLRKTLWVRVSLFALFGVLVAGLASLSNRLFPGAMPFDISTDAIDSLLTIIASSMLAVTTFSVGALTAAYSSATSHGTARATQLLTEDRVVQTSLATFVGSFLFSIVGLIALKLSAYGPEGRAVLFAVTLGMIALIVLALLRWINQLTRLGRVSDTVGRIEQETRDAMEARLTLPFLGGAPLPATLTASGLGTGVMTTDLGYVAFIDTAGLSERAETADCRIDILVLPGTFVYADTMLARITSPGDPPDDLVDAVRSAFTIAASRNFDQDPRFGLVVLTEVALRALSPAVNDPGTAIDVIGRHTRLLSFWAERWEAACTKPPEFPRLRVPALDYGDLFDDAFTLIARDGAGQIDVMLCIARALAALSRIGPDASRQAARDQLQLALHRATAALAAEADRRRLQAAVDGIVALKFPVHTL